MDIDGPFWMIWRLEAESWGVCCRCTYLIVPWLLGLWCVTLYGLYWDTVVWWNPRHGPPCGDSATTRLITTRTTNSSAADFRYGIVNSNLSELGDFNCNILQWWIQDFPEGGTPTPDGAPTYYLTNFSQKLHENKEILAQRRGASLALD